MTTMFQDKVKCAVCGKESDHSFNGNTEALGELDLDINPDKIELSALPYIVQRCPSCGYCNSRLSELIKGADEWIESDEYKAQLTNDKFPELANLFLCAGLLHEIAEEYNKAGWDCIHAAQACDEKKNSEAAIYCRKRALSMFEEAMDCGQKFEDSPSKETLLLTDITRKVGLFDIVEK